MTLKNFIKENRPHIDRIIRNSGYKGTINDEDRRGWILNDEGLYLNAIREGVKI